ncbi:MAG: hypothetical protein M3Q31_06725 [Actinomycetota bacterium]|nr:hypothetical protein [Actinomycetota bacterium]
MRRRAHILLATLAGLTSLGLGSGTAGTTDPASSAFSAHVDNPWFPLTPGTTYIYRGVKDGKPARDVLTVTHRTATIDAAPCVVVQDRLYLRGRLSERTTDWYTQDAKGNVWYFGEDTAELDASGTVTSTEGSWRAGVGKARPGIYMPAHPRRGQSARQEYLKGHAEDHFQVLSLRAAVAVPYASSTHALLTKEWTPLEPGVLDHKLYLRGVGTALEQSIKGGTERLALVALKRGS